VAHRQGVNGVDCLHGYHRLLCRLDCERCRASSGTIDKSSHRNHQHRSVRANHVLHDGGNRRRSHPFNAVDFVSGVEIHSARIDAERTAVHFLNCFFHIILFSCRRFVCVLHHASVHVAVLRHIRHLRHQEHDFGERVYEFRDSVGSHLRFDF